MINIVLKFADLTYEKYNKLIDYVYSNPLIEEVICEDLPYCWRGKFENKLITEEYDEDSKCNVYWYNKEVKQFLKEVETLDPYKLKEFIMYHWDEPMVEAFIKMVKTW